jgi:hypothetical protein
MRKQAQPNTNLAIMKKRSLTIALLAAVALNTAAFAAMQEFVIDFQPEGGDGRTGGGSGTLVFDTELNTLTFNDILWSGLSAPANNAHIHGPSGPFPDSAGVLYPLQPTYTTMGDTFGTLSGTLPLVDGTGGFDLSDQLLQLYNGEWYVNIHSTAFPGGEIRGHILIPEPSTWALLGLGTAVLAWGLRRRAC